MTEDSPATEPPADKPTSRAAIIRVLRNPMVRRLQIASFGSTLGDWAYSTAIVIWAYEHGGAGAVGGYQAGRFVAMAIAGPLGGVIADRISRRRFMISTDTIRAILVGSAAVTIAQGGPASIVYALAIATAVIGAPFRAAQAGLLPELVDAPDDLVTANAIAGNLENVTIFAGPALAGILLSTTNVQTVLWVNVASFIWSNLLLFTIRTKATPVADQAPAEKTERFWGDLSAGLGMVGRHRDLRNVALISGATGFSWGGLTVFMVLLATDVLKSGPEGFGYLNSVLGVTTVIGGLLVLGRVSSGRLGQDILIGALGWGLPLVALAAFPSPFTAVAALAVIGISEPFSDVACETIPQRVTPPDFISRVFSAIDSAMIAPMALGALLAPALVDQFGLRASLAISGGVVLAMAFALWPAMNDLDRRLRAPEGLEVLTAPTIGLIPRHHWSVWHIRRGGSRYGVIRG